MAKKKVTEKQLEKILAEPDGKRVVVKNEDGSIKTELAKKAKVKEKWNIEELERILDNEEDCALQIMPNGEIRRADNRKRKIKPLTMRENLGGEYVHV